MEEISRTKCRAALPALEARLDTQSACSALGWAIIARDVSLIAHIITRTLSQSMSTDSATTDSATLNLVKEVARIVTCLFDDRTSTGQKKSQPWIAPLITSPEFAFISRYAEFQALLQTGEDREAIICTALELLSRGDISGGFYVPPRFKLHLLKQLQPHLSPTGIKREHVKTLSAVVSELKAGICLHKRVDEDEQKLLMALSALVVQAKAFNTMNACSRVECNDQPMAGDYAFSEDGVL